MIFNSMYEELFTVKAKMPQKHGLNINRLRLSASTMELLPQSVVDFISVCDLYCPEEDLLCQYEYVDIESRHLKKGEATCNNMWHVDGHPKQKPEDVRVFLFVDSEPTEFLLGKVEGEGKNAKEFHHSINGGRSIRVPTNSIISYNGHGIHRGVFAEKAGWRTRYRLVKSSYKFNDTKGLSCLKKILNTQKLS